MQEVQRFNKVLKFIVLLGDVLLLNLLLWGFELIFGTRFYSGVSSSLYQGMVLLSLCYLVSSGSSSGADHDPCASQHGSFCFIFHLLFVTFSF